MASGPILRRTTTPYLTLTSDSALSAFLSARRMALRSTLQFRGYSGPCDLDRCVFGHGGISDVISSLVSSQLEPILHLACPWLTGTRFVDDTSQVTLRAHLAKIEGLRRQMAVVPTVLRSMPETQKVFGVCIVDYE